MTEIKTLIEMLETIKITDPAFAPEAATSLRKSGKRPSPEQWMDLLAELHSLRVEVERHKMFREADDNVIASLRAKLERCERELKWRRYHRPKGVG
jgi:hypothetical protein